MSKNPVFNLFSAARLTGTETRIGRLLRQPLIGAGGIYAAVVLLMTWPAALQLEQYLIGNNIDNWIFYWNDWWLRQAITGGQDWFYTPYLFYPTGTSLLTHSHSFLNSLLAFLLTPLAGSVAAYNLTLLFGLWVGAVGMFLLIREITQQPLAALGAGFVFSFAPYHLTKVLSHMNLGSIHWWPFYILFLRRLLQRKRGRDAAAAGLFAALTLWSGWQLAVLLGLWTLLYLAWQGRQVLDRRLLGQLTLLGIVTVLVCLPLLGPIVGNLSALADTAVLFDEGTDQQTDLLAYWIPPTYHPFWGEEMVTFYERFVANRASMPYWGYGALVLALLALWKRRSAAGFWAMSAAVWLLLAAGSVLRWNGMVYEQIPLPYKWLGTLFPISTIRSPDRFNLLLVLSVAVLAGLGLAYLVQKRRWWTAGLLTGLVVVEYLIHPLPAWELPPGSPFFDQMAADTAAYGVVSYPMGYSLSKLWLYYQTLHEKPMVEGHVSRYTADTYAFIAQHPLLQALYQTAERPRYISPTAIPPPASPLTALGPALRQLQADGIRYLLVHYAYATESDLAHFQESLPLVPVYRDGTLAVYDVTRPYGWYYGESPVRLTPQLELVQAQTQLAEQALHLQLLGRAAADEAAPVPCSVQLLDGEGKTLASAAVSFFGDEAGWQRDDLSLQKVELPLTDSLADGRSDIQLGCEAADVFNFPDQLGVQDGGHILLLRQALHLSYNDQIALEGYRRWTEGSDLHLTWHWWAQRRPQQDYKLFVHLLDEQGAVVRQVDTVPCGWSCPTSGWQAGQAISDSVVVPLWGLPQGTYRLAVGWYVEETGQRLPVKTEAGELVADAYFVLPEPFPITAAD